MIETYPNYFTEVEEHFRRARGTPLFRLSSNDWVLIEKWKKAGIPLEAIFRGIDVAFEKWRKNPARARDEMVNSVAYCEQAVTAEARAIANRTSSFSKDTTAPFSLDDVRTLLSATPQSCAKRAKRIRPSRSKPWISTRCTATWSSWISGSR